MTMNRPALAALIAIGLLLSACHKAAEAPANETNATLPLPEAPPLPEASANAVQSAPAAKPLAVAPPDNEHITDEEQIREDAEATGMTSRIHSDEQGTTNGQR